MLPLTFLCLFVSLAVLRASHQRPSGRRSETPTAHVNPEGRCLDAVRMALTALLSGNVVVFGFHHVFGLFPWFASFAVAFPDWARWLGVVGALASLAMLHQVHRDLGEAFSVRLQVRKDHSLVTNGWYARIRHPMYSALCAFFLSSSVVAAHLFIAIPALAIVAILCARTGAEERMMEAHFGETYRQYRDQTGRLWPRITPRTRKG